jgi:hypothetical protein
MRSSYLQIKFSRIVGLIRINPRQALTLRELPDASIKWPREEEFEDLTRLIVERHPRLWGAFGFIDGLKLPVQESSDNEIENATYNGWLHTHAINNVLVFAPDGKHRL